MTDQEYDEEREGTLYIMRNYSYLTNTNESYALRILEAKELQGTEKDAGGYMEGRFISLSYNFDNDEHPEIKKLVALNSYWECQKQVAKRIIEDNNVSIKRCPDCDQIVKTPKARMCLWCNHEWFDKEGKNGCVECGKNLWLRDEDAGSHREIYRTCDKCFENIDKKTRSL
jgi:hypothetical protein